MNNRSELLGLRVVLVHDVDRYPHFVAHAGRTGVVTLADGDFIAVRMDKPLSGAEEWENQIWWEYDSSEDFFSDCRVVP